MRPRAHPPMLTLSELQRDFRLAMLADDDRIASLVAGDGLEPAARLALYRHHVLDTLTDALKSTFPVVCRLVDERFFRYVADRYIRECPPDGPCLFEFGSSFPRFIGELSPARELVYLADVARLEWALNRARLAEDAAPIDPGALRAVPPESVPSIVFQLEPSLTLLRSPWPIDRLWRANQSDGEGIVDLDAGGAWLEVRRAGDDVGFRALDPATHAFRAAIAGSEPLGDAADAALGVDPRFDLAAALHALLDDGVVIGLSVNGLPKKES